MMMEESSQLTLFNADSNSGDVEERIIQSFRSAGVSQVDLRQIINTFSAKQSDFIRRFTRNFVNCYRSFDKLVKDGGWLNKGVEKVSNKAEFLMDTATMGLALKIVDTLAGSGNILTTVAGVFACCYKYNKILDDERKKAEQCETANRIIESINHIKNSDLSSNIEKKAEELADIFYVRFQLSISFIYSDGDIDHFSRFLVSLVWIYCDKNSLGIKANQSNLRDFVKDLLSVTELEAFTQDKKYNELLQEFKNKNMGFNAEIIEVLKKSSVIAGNIFYSFLHYAPRHFSLRGPTWNAWEIICYSPIYNHVPLSFREQRGYYLRQEQEKQRADKYPPQIIRTSEDNIAGYVLSVTETSQYLGEDEFFDGVHALLIREPTKLHQEVKKSISLLPLTCGRNSVCGVKITFLKLSLFICTLFCIPVVVVPLVLLVNFKNDQKKQEFVINFLPTGMPTLSPFPSVYPTSLPTLSPAFDDDVSAVNDDDGDGMIVIPVVIIAALLLILGGATCYYMCYIRSRPITPRGADRVNSAASHVFVSAETKINLKEAYKQWRGNQKKSVQVAWEENNFLSMQNRSPWSGGFFLPAGDIEMGNRQLLQLTSNNPLQKGVFG